MERSCVKGEQRSRINDLPDQLLCHILSFLSTRDSVRSSVLSKRWRNLWLQVPVFDLNSLQFDEDVLGFIGFLDKFLESKENLVLNRFKLIYHYVDIDDDDSFVESWIDALVRRRVRHLDFQVNSDETELVWMPLSLYSCNTLVSLSLYHVALCELEQDFPVSLPCLKIMHLERVIANLGRLISSCPVLEKLTMIRDSYELLEIMCVRSKSLKSLALVIEASGIDLLEDHAVEIEAPKLERMSLCDHLSRRIVIHSIAPSAVVQIDVNFNREDGYTLLDQDDDDDDSKRTMICNFLTGISTVCLMEISSDTLEFGLVRGNDYEATKEHQMFCKNFGR
ncbi:hypothetical protein Bca4012_062076 [Brassica carinata]